MANMATTASSHAEFDAWLGKKQTRKLAHNTYAERVGDDIAIRLHATRVVTFHPDSTITLDSGGWRTVTTKDRMHAVLPRRLFLSSVDGVWQLGRRADEWPAPVGFMSEFYDGMRFTVEGEMVTAALIDSGRELKQVKRQISGYVKRYTDERVAELIANAAEHGTAGDCWGCAMVDAETGEGGVFGVDHLREHIAEGYTMASTMVNALRHVGYRDHQLAVVVRHGDIVRRAMRRYLVETLTTSHGARPVGRVGQTEHWGG